MTTSLLIAEVQGERLSPATLSTLTAAKQLQEPIDILLIGEGLGAAAVQASELAGIHKVLVADNAVYADKLPENLSLLIAEFAGQYTHVLAPANSFGKNLLPRLAALLQVEQVSDLTAIVSADTFVRPIYAGNALATVQTSDPIKLLTIRPSAFAPCKDKQAAVGIEAIDTVIPAVGVKLLERQESKQDRPALANARIVVSGGRGLQNAEQFSLIYALADVLQAAVGASRAAVDAGFIANDYQVGQTGQVVAPDLYFAIGISGAIQHIAGIRGSKIIIAINRDPDAAIFQIADIGLVGDLFKLVPELTELLAKRKASI